MACHGCRPQIAVLCRSWINTLFAREVPGSLFVLGQHFGGPYRDPEKTPDNSEAGEQTGVVPT